MQAFKTHDGDIMKEVAKEALSRGARFDNISVAQWNIAYELVLTRHQVETVDWMLANMTLGDNQ